MTDRHTPGTPADGRPYGLGKPGAGSVNPPAGEDGPMEAGNVKLPFAQRTALAVRETFPDAVVEVILFREEWTVTIHPARIVEVCRFLRDQWNYKMCHDVTSVDLLPREPRFMVVYTLLNLDRATRFRVKAPLSSDEPEIDTVVPIWTGADWMEREVYDLMGIRFRGHPDLRRILMMADYEEHPLRKDFPLTGFDVGVDTLKD